MKNKKVYKYTNMYMSLGICIGVSTGVALGSGMNNIGVGISMGLAVGIAMGLAIGSAKDKKLSENLVEITAIEEGKGELVTVTAKDADGNEKKYEMKKKAVQSEKLTVGCTAADDGGTLVSIE